MPTLDEVAGYASTLENGQTYKSLAGDTGVGTAGGRVAPVSGRGRRTASVCSMTPVDNSARRLAKKMAIMEI